MDRKVVEVSSLSLSFSLFLSLSLSLSVSLFLSLSLSLSLTIYLPTYLSIYLCIYVSMYLCIYVSIYLSIDLSIYRSIDLSIYLSLYLSSNYLSIYPILSCPVLSYPILSYSILSYPIYLSVCLSVYLQAWKQSYSARLPPFLNLTTSKNAAIQRDFLNFWTWQRQKRSNSARLFHFKLTTSKTKQFCETSFKYGKLSAELTASYQCVLRFFHSTCCHAKSSSQNWRSDSPKCNPSQEMERPDLLFWQRVQSLAPATQNDIWTSKSAPNPSVFCTFDFEMCFAPQRRALFRHLNFQKWSGAEVFCAFWFRNVLRATTACTFSTSQLLKVLRVWGAFFCIFHWQMCFTPQRRALFRHLNFQKWSEHVVFWCVLMCFVHFDFEMCSRHNGVQFCISHLPSGLRTRRLSEPTFRASGATNHWKNTVFRDFPTFSRICIFFLLRLSLFWSSFFLFSSLTLPTCAFHLSILSEVWLLNFLP